MTSKPLSLVLVTATRWSREAFEQRSLLGRSLPPVGQNTPLRLRLYCENTSPLGEVYNGAIEDAAPDDVLIFLHDDVHLDDWMMGWRVEEALSVFDVVGVVGNVRCHARQDTWYLQPSSVDGEVWRPGPWDHESLSGAIHHGVPGRQQLSYYGPTPRTVRLMDGVFIAVRARSLHETGVRFDPQLGFHFYDLDFCHAATAAGLRLGTWPIAITHASSGDSVQSQAWRDSREIYLKKWSARE